MRRLYLDHNATTPLRPEARERLIETLDALGGNPSSVHAAGRLARQVLDAAREEVAAALGAAEDEIVFTSGGTESNNLALFGVLGAAGPGARLVTTRTEHSAVLGPARALEERGHPVRLVGVDAAARVDRAALLAAAEGSALVSVSAANSEVGTLTDVAALAADLQERYGDSRPRIHVDAVQALGRVPLTLREWGIDLASFSAHKVGGPPGCGVLYRRRGTPLRPLLFGGGQEGELRPGTENAAGVAATALAIRLAVAERETVARRMRALSTTLWSEVRAAMPEACLLGPPIDAMDRLPNTLNVLLPEVDGRVLVTRLDLAGLEASAGSACASGSLEPSHVLSAMGLSRERARAGLRLSLGRVSNDEDVRFAVDILSTTLVDARKSELSNARAKKP